MQFNVPHTQTRFTCNFLVQPIQVTAGAGGVQTQVGNPTAEAGRQMSYMVNSHGWQPAGYLVPVGNYYYASAFTGVFQPNDVVRTCYKSTNGVVVDGDSFFFS